MDSAARILNDFFKEQERKGACIEVTLSESEKIGSIVNAMNPDTSILEIIDYVKQTENQMTRIKLPNNGNI